MTARYYNFVLNFDIKNSESWFDYRQKQRIFLFVTGTSPFWDSPKVLQCAQCALSQG